MIRSRKKLPRDANQLAYEIVRQSTEESEEEPKEETPTPNEPPAKERSPISEYLAEIGRRGGLKGGRARADKLSAKKRQEIAKKAAEARWKK